MNLKVNYDPDASVLHIMTGEAVNDGASLLDDPGVVVELATEDGHDIVGLIVMGASAYLPLGLGYDADADTLLFGTATSDPAMITENGDIVGYWQVDDEEPDSFRDPIGVAIRKASKHLAEVLSDHAILA
jgi:uncharacterized protein YuzE